MTTSTRSDVHKDSFRKLSIKDAYYFGQGDFVYVFCKKCYQKFVSGIVFVKAKLDCILALQTQIDEQAKKIEESEKELRRVQEESQRALEVEVKNQETREDGFAVSKELVDDYLQICYVFPEIATTQQAFGLPSLISEEENEKVKRALRLNINTAFSKTLVEYCSKVTESLESTKEKLNTQIEVQKSLAQIELMQKQESNEDLGSENLKSAVLDGSLENFSKTIDVISSLKARLEQFDFSILQ